MLSYQHHYHAGNPADVHKHALLAWTLDYLSRKPKSLTYFETHAGRGLYDLSAPEALKTGEAAAGVGRLVPFLPEKHPYRQALAKTRATHGAHAYPGSPMIAALALRDIDPLHFAELHPGEHAHLAQAMAPHFAQVYHQDGIEMVLSRTPPEPRRGALLVDPSWEQKDDYERMPKLLYDIIRRWNVGVLMLWYPQLQDGRHRPMVRAMRASFPGLLVSEVAFPPVRKGHGMIGSGFAVLNPPHGLTEEAARIETLFRRHAGR